jgi:hypothetical protein
MHVPAAAAGGETRVRVLPAWHRTGQHRTLTTVDLDRSTRRRIETQQQLRDRAFSGARRTCERHALAWRDFEAEVLEDIRPIIRISEADVLELYDPRTVADFVDVYETGSAGAFMMSPTRATAIAAC